MEYFTRIVKNLIAVIIIFSITTYNSIAHNVDDSYEFYNDKMELINFDHFDEQVVIIHFWATWCQSCFLELQSLDKIQKDFRKKPLKVIAISEDFKAIESIISYYAHNGIKNIQIYADPRNVLFKKLNMKTIPSTVILNKEHEIIGKFNNSISWGDGVALSIIEEALNNGN